MMGTLETARKLGVSKRTVHRLVKRGELTPLMAAPGGAYLFDDHDVAECARKANQ